MDSISSIKMPSKGYVAVDQDDRIDVEQNTHTTKQSGLPHSTVQRSREIAGRLAVSLCLLLVGLVIGAFGGQQTRKAHQQCTSTTSLPASFFPAFATVRTEFVNGGVFTRNDSRGDLAWNEMVPKGAGYLRVNDPRQYGLPPSEQLSSLDGEHAEMYQASVVHQLHCMATLREYIRSFERGNTPPPNKHMHVTHCIEYVRQAILCTADTTLEQANEKGDFNAEGAVHQCRDWNAVKTFLEERRVDDDRPPILIT